MAQLSPDSTDSTHNAADGRPAIALVFHQPHNLGQREDGTLYLSIQGAPSRKATLLHDEDDFADRVFYFAMDLGNNIEAPRMKVDRRPAFILRAVGYPNSPIHINRSFSIMCVKE